jgi:hypothetical protein
MKPLFIAAEEQNILINQLTEKYMRLFFSGNKKVIKGPEILHFCDNSQINKFIFFQLHQNWNKYQSSLQHPHYDFQHEEVRKALSNFLSVVSAHISIREQDFRPFVEKAVFNCISLLLSPEETFDSFYFAAKDNVGLVLMEKNATHFSYFDFILQGIILYHQQQHMPLVRKAVFLEKFAKAEELAARKGQSLETYRRELFKRLTDKDLFEVARTADGSIPMPELPPGSGREEGVIPIISDAEFTVSDEIQEELVLQETTLEAEPATPLSDTDHLPSASDFVVQTPEPEANPEPEIPVTQASEPEAVENVPFMPQEEIPSPQAETPVADHSSENTAEIEAQDIPPTDQPEKPKTLADLFQQNATPPAPARTTHISLDNIPIHKQFQFSQKIFLGNNVQFRSFVQEVNTLDTMEKANRLLEDTVIKPNNLKLEEPLLQEFIQILQNRYQSN